MADQIDKIPECLCSNAGLPAGFTSALSFNEQVQWLLNAYNNLLSMIPDNMEFNGVKFIPQALTENEKNVARENIGAGTSEITQQDIDNTINNNTISYKLQQNLSAGQKELARKNIGAGTSNAKYAVEYVNQNLTEQQKEDARKNIGAASEKLNGAVLTTPQALTENEKFTARNNIGIAYGFGDVPVLYNHIQLYPETYKARARNNIGCPSGIYSATVTTIISTDSWTEIENLPLYKVYPLLVDPEFLYTYEGALFNIKTISFIGQQIDLNLLKYSIQIVNGKQCICIIILKTDFDKLVAGSTPLTYNIYSLPINNFPNEWIEKQSEYHSTFTYNNLVLRSGE